MLNVFFFFFLSLPILSWVALNIVLVSLNAGQDQDVYTESSDRGVGGVAPPKSIEKNMRPVVAMQERY